MTRQGSSGPYMSAPSSQAPSMYRSRSASSTHAYQPQPNGRYSESPPSHDDPSGAYRKRESDSSHATDRSSTSASQGGHSGRRGAVSSGTSSATSFPSPAHSHPSSVGTAVAANAIRVKVFFGEDTFVVVVLDTATYAELVDKVIGKIRLCGAANSKAETTALRLRYRDEDGDRISITSEEDVAMAFETAKAMASDKGHGAPLELVLYATVDA